MIVSTQEMKSIEAAAFASGIAAEDLMDEAGYGIATVILQFFPTPGDCRVVCGKGNNAADALVAARHLHQLGWNIEVDCAFSEEELSPLCAKKLRELSGCSSFGTGFVSGPSILIDGLLGIGSVGKPASPIAEKIEEIRRARQEHGFRVISVDIPSGLDTDTGIPDSCCVEADLTVALGAAKSCLLSDTATSFVGRLAVVPLSGLEIPESDSLEILTPQTLRNWLPVRPFDSYKGNFGHVGIIAGSVGYFGAAKLCCAGALRGGAGLVTLLAKPENFPYLATGAPPECMVQPVKDFRDCLNANFDALAIGPGLVEEKGAEMVEIIRNAECPVVIDAGALGVLAGGLKSIRLVNGPRILTPHAGEMDKMFRMPGATREELARAFVEEFPSVLLLKGARTIIAAPGRPLFYNTTGTPGMGTGGMGDVLTGVVAALCAQGLRPSNAAALGAWACGRAAELAILDGESEQSLLAGDIPARIGRAFSSLGLPSVY